MIAIALARDLGAVCHTDLDGLVHRRHPEFPWGTFAVSTLGCLLLNTTTSVFFSMNPGALQMVTARLFGGFTTFSTAMLDTVKFARVGRRLASAGLVLGTAGSSLLAFPGGMTSASIL